MSILEIKILYFQSFKIKHEFKKKGGERWVNDRTKLAYILLITGLSSSKSHSIKAIILMMPKTQLKNQESSKFQESKSCSIKNQDPSKESREDSRYTRTSRKASR